MVLTEQTEKLVTDWFRRVRESQKAHYECANHFKWLNYWLGIPALGLSTIVGSAVFFSIEYNASGPWKILVGVISLTSAILSALQTFLGFAERADRHRTSGAEYGAIRRDLELLKTLPPNSIDGIQQRLDGIRHRMDELAKNSPGVPTRFKEKIDRELKGRDHHRIFSLPATTSK